MKSTIKINRREYLLKESENLDSSVKITDWISKESVFQ